MLILLMIALALTQTPMFRHWLRDKITTEINSEINGRLTIGDLEGNLITGIGFKNTTITAGKDTLLKIPEISMAYSPLKLLTNEIHVRTVSIREMKAYVEQYQDSSWNIINVFTIDTAIAKDTSDTEGSFPWKISINDLHLSIRQIDINALQDIIPKRIENLDLQLEGTYTAGGQTLKINKFGFQTYDPDLIIRDLQFSAARDAERITLSDFLLETGSSRVAANATIDRDTVRQSAAALHLTGDDLSELALFIPHITLPAETSIDCEIEYLADSLSLCVRLKDEHKSLDAVVGVEKIHALLDHRIPSTGFSVEIDAKGFESDRWFRGNIYQIKGDAHLYANGIYYHDRWPDVVCRLTANNLKIAEWQIDSLKLEGDLAGENLTVDLNLDAPRGVASLHATIAELRGRQDFDVHLRAEQMDLSGLWLPDTVLLILSGGFNMKGISLDPDQFNGELLVNVTQMQIANTIVSDIYIDARKQDDLIAIKELVLGGDALHLECQGWIDTDLQSDLHYEVQWYDLKSFSRFIPVLERLKINGYTSGSIRGKPGDFSGEIGFGFYNTLYDSLYADSLTGRGQITYQDSQLTAMINAEVTGIKSGKAGIDRISLRAEIDNARYDISAVMVVNPSINMETGFTIKSDSIIGVNILQLDLGLYGTRWIGGSGSTWLMIADSSYAIHNFELTRMEESGFADNTRLRINGEIDLAGMQDLEVRIENFNLALFDSLLEEKGQFEGILNTNFSVNGPADHPELKGMIIINQGRLRNQKFQDLSGNIKLSSGKIVAHTILNINNRDSLQISAALPAEFSLTDRIFGLPSKQGGELRFATSGISLAVLMAGIPNIAQANGRMQCDLTIKDQPSGYEMYGDLKLGGGTLEIPEYGLNYRQIDLNLSVWKQRINLKNFALHTIEGGKLEMAGFLDMQNYTLSGGDLTLNADRFYLTKHKDYDLQISADAFLQVIEGSPQFGGTVDLIRANIYLPGILSKSSKVLREGASKKSLLMRALETRSGEEAKDEAPSKGQSVQNDKPGIFLNFIQNLEGKIQLQFQKNVWLRSRDMRIELSGDLDLIRDKTETKLFGLVKVERGHYDILGKRFNFIKGEVTFRGREELNPLIDFTAEYGFRSAQREKEYIRLTVQGELHNPQYQFYFNDTPITETEAVSYVLFGRSQDELSFSQQSDMTAGAQGEITMGIVSNIISDRLARSFGDDLKLDIIEVNARDNWKSATFLVGKYITEDLFLTYERSFGESDENVLNPETISLEYQVTRSLYLQLIQGDTKVSGIDMFLKIEW